MARPSRLKPEELDMRTLFKIDIVNWDTYQVKLRQYEWIQLRAMRNSDTLLEENLSTRGLFFDLLRFSAAGRKPGRVVAGNDEFLTLSRLARYLWITVAELLPPLKRLMETDRIKLTTPTAEEKGEPSGAPEPKPKPKEKAPRSRTTPHAFFWRAWDGLCKRRYGRTYDKGTWDDANVKKVLTEGNLDRYIAYAAHFHLKDGAVGTDNSVHGMRDVIQPTIDNFLKRVPEYSAKLAGADWKHALKYAADFLKEGR